MTPETVRKAVAEYFVALRAMNPDAWAATFAAEGTTEDPAGSPPVKGHAALKQRATAMWAPWVRIALRETEVFVAANEAAIKWTGEGRAKNGRDFRFEGIDIIAVDEQGKVQSVRGFWDTSILVELAATPRV
jgi:ketosteroid isomerase-like protein